MDLVQRIEHFVRKFSADLPYWIAALLTGVVAVGYAQLMVLTEKFALWILSQNSWLLLITAPVCFILSWFIVYRYAPEAKGSGIPQVMVAIDAEENTHSQQMLERLLGIKTLIVKVLSSLLCVLGGGAVGREGPTIQIAASIFHFVNKLSKKLSLSVNYHFGLIAGGAAGIAAAFNTPLGGLVFAIEELTSSHFNKFKTSLISGVIIAGLVAQWLGGSYLYLGYPQLNATNTGFVLWAALVGVIAGSAGAVFGKVLYILMSKRAKLKSASALMLFAGICGLTMAALVLYFDSRSIGPGREVLSHLLFKDGGDGDWRLVIARFVGPLVSYLSGGAGGIFAPALAAGGAIGAFLGNILQPVFVNTFILIGMIAFLTGVTRAPFTSFVLVLEMTDRHSAIFSMMIAALLASVVAKAIDPKSFYDRVKEDYEKIIPSIKSQNV